MTTLEPEELLEQLREARDLYDIVLKTARRVARDLGHAIGHMTDNTFRPRYQERYEHFNRILTDTNDYRLKLHSELQGMKYTMESRERELKYEISQLQDKLQIQRNKEEAPRQVPSSPGQETFFRDVSDPPEEKPF